MANYQIAIDVFEGPLDLLLHLVRKHELEILDIPIAFITQKYLEYLDAMQRLDIDALEETVNRLGEAFGVTPEFARVRMRKYGLITKQKE